jgi:thioredoxin-related protein
MNRKRGDRVSAVVSARENSPVRKKRADSLLLLLLLASLFLNVYLGWKVKNSRSTNQPNAVTLSPGQKVAPVTAVSLGGKQQIISYDATDKPTVFYVLSPSCVWCERNKANIEKLAELKGNDFRFIALSLAEPGLTEYLKGHHINFPVYSQLASDSIHSLGLGATPQTIVISPEGRILKNWTGAYIERVRPEVEAYFGIRLPGLISGSK